MMTRTLFLLAMFVATYTARSQNLSINDLRKMSKLPAKEVDSYLVGKIWKLVKHEDEHKYSDAWRYTYAYEKNTNDNKALAFLTVTAYEIQLKFFAVEKYKDYVQQLKVQGYHLVDKNSSRNDKVIAALTFGSDFETDLCNVHLKDNICIKLCSEANNGSAVYTVTIPHTKK